MIHSKGSATLVKIVSYSSWTVAEERDQLQSIELTHELNRISEGVVHGGLYCEFPNGRSACSSKKLALFYPNACLEAGGTDWTNDCDSLYTEPNPWNCFSGHATVAVQGKGDTRMDELQVGDRVLTGDGTYSKVYTFSHKDGLAEVSYLQILTESMDKRHPLEITGMHLLYVFDQKDSKKKLKFAQEVKVGDFLVASHTASQSRVVSIRSINRRGLYTPITSSGNIVVNRVLTSCYTSLGFLDAYFSEHMLHWLSHGGMVPYRLFCAASSCQGETYDARRGYNPWVYFLFEIQRILTSSAHSLLLKLSIALVGATPLLLSLIFGNILCTDSMFSLEVHVAALLFVISVLCKSRSVMGTMSGIENKRSKAGSSPPLFS